jgi:hypothetical protein
MAGSGSLRQRGTQLMRLSRTGMLWVGGVALSCMLLTRLALAAGEPETQGGQAGPGDATWQSLRIDKVGWGGIEQDMAKSREENLDYLKGLSHVYLSSGPADEAGRAKWYVIYYPSADNWAPPASKDAESENDLKVARIALDQPQGKRVSVKAVGDGVLMGSSPPYLVNKLMLTAVARPDGMHLWYVHPFRSLVVDYDLTRGTAAKSITLPLEMNNQRRGMDGFFMDFGVDPNSGSPEFVMVQNGGLVNWIYDLSTSRWKPETICRGGARPGILLSKQGAYVLSGATTAVLYTEQEGQEHWRPEPIETGQPTNKIAFSRGPVSEENPGVDVTYTELDRSMFLGADGLVHVFQYNSGADTLSILSKKDDGWEADLIKRVKPAKNALAPSFCVVPDGDLHIACYDPNLKEVQHPRR